MKLKIIQLLSLLFISSPLFSQDEIESKWKNSGNAVFLVNQSSFSNWTSGGQSSISGTLKIDYNFNYADGSKNQLDKLIEFGYLENNLPEYLYNIGTGKDITIKELAETIQRVIGHQGNILWDASKPDGTPRKLMDVSKMKELGWQYSTELEDGIKKTYLWFLDNIDIIKEIKL